MISNFLMCLGNVPNDGKEINFMILSVSWYAFLMCRRAVSQPLHVPLDGVYTDFSVTGVTEICSRGHSERSQPRTGLRLTPAGSAEGLPAQTK